jgi:4-oxalocrotonate tautomerase
MPHVIVKLWPGKSEQQKTRLAEEESVSVAMEEVKSQDWVEKVYVPDVKEKWGKLYKKPGYHENDL